MARRIVSGMRPTGALHLGHLRGVLGNWRALQEAGGECFFFIADWHALTTDYNEPENLRQYGRDMVSAWLAAGIDPARAVLFRQSEVPAHAELFALLSMICPLPWLAHLPTYKEQKESRGELDTYGFLGYPLLQSADIMIYGADAVPVGEDQVPHVEFTREIARRFNRFYGAGDSFQERRRAVGEKIGGADKALRAQKRAYAEKGDKAALENALQRAGELALSEEEKQILRADLRYGGEEILRPPQALLAQTAKLPGTDGRKMSKSYGNTIGMFDAPEVVDKKIARMQTDPARVRREDPGTPEQCPVWEMHKVFSDEETRAWADAGCRSAKIGCVECKKKLAGFINAELAPVLARRGEGAAAAEDILADGAKKARAAAEETMQAVRRAMRVLP